MQQKNIQLNIPFSNASPLLRQTPGGKGVWGNCSFFLNSHPEKTDFCVVYEGLLTTEKVFCNPSHIIFVTGEPQSVRSYNKKFLEQFGLIITSQPEIQGSNVIHTQTALPWNVGKEVSGKSIVNISQNYETLKTMPFPPKTKLLSVVTSNKAFTQGHRDRLAFVKSLQEHFKDDIDVFGPGLGVHASDNDPLKFTYHTDKWDSIAQYKYHIAIENSFYSDYWTEKLADTYLAGAYPFYYGCPNLEDYFSPHAFTAIDIHKPDEAIALIEKKVTENTYEKSHHEIMNAKVLVLDTYNLFPMICRLINDPTPFKEQNPRLVTLRPESDFTKASIFIKRISNGIKKMLK